VRVLTKSLEATAVQSKISLGLRDRSGIGSREGKDCGEKNSNGELHDVYVEYYEWVRFRGVV
jgi:hypothetical protein